MNQHFRDKDQTSPEAGCSYEQNEEKAARTPAVRPHWPIGLQISRNKELTCFIPEGLTVALSREAFEQLFSYAYSTASEISCLGTVKEEGERFRIERFYLVGQAGSLGHTELDQEALAALAEELLAQGKAEEARSLRCWAHSHPQMDVFWSKTGEETCKRLVGDYLVSLVVSDDFALRCRIDVGGAVPFTIDHVPVLVEMPVDLGELERYAAEVREKVKYTPLALSATTSERAKEAVFPKYCRACDSFHVQEKCPLASEAGRSQAREGHAKQCRVEDVVSDVKEFEFFDFDEMGMPF